MSQGRDPGAALEAACFAPLLDLVDRGGDRFGAPTAPENEGRMFGGQFLAQTLAAAQRCVEGDRHVHSLHGYFLREGDVSLGTELHVERVRDGRSFSQRSVRVLQQGRELFRSLLSFQVPEPGLEYDAPRMPEAPPAEAVPLSYDDFTEAELAKEGPWEGAVRPMEIRYVNPPTAPRGEPVSEPQLMWMRISERLGADPCRHEAGLAYLADSTLIDHVLLPHGRRWQDDDIAGASLDHAMWFHRRTRADQWLLFDQRVEWTGAARGLAAGRFFDRNGRLVASCAQEGLIRTS